MLYHDQCNEVIVKFRMGLIGKDLAYKELEHIENRAYRLIPNAEPDGDITYCVACAIDEVDEHNKP